MANRAELKNKIAILEYDNYAYKEELEILQKEYTDALVLLRQFINIQHDCDMTRNISYQKCIESARAFTKEHDVHVIWIRQDVLDRLKEMS